MVLFADQFSQSLCLLQPSVTHPCSLSHDEIDPQRNESNTSNLVRVRLIAGVTVYGEQECEQDFEGFKASVLFTYLRLTALPCAPLYLPLISPTRIALPVPLFDRTGLGSRLPALELGRDDEEAFLQI